MKQRTILFIMVLLATLTASASVNINGVFYKLDDNNSKATVTSGDTEYTGSVTIPETVTYNDVNYSVTSIGSHAFYNCTSLTSVTIPNSVLTIENLAFFGCSGLTSVTIPSNVTSIGNSAFSGCSGLTSVTIPNSVLTIENLAFNGCIGLTSVTIPNSVTSIGDYAFEGCTGLTSVTIPNRVTSIESGAFKGCSALTSIIIPNSVTRIYDYAFSDCSGLKDVYCYAQGVPKTGSSAFSYSPIDSATLHVPAASLETYKATSPWKRFGSIAAVDISTKIDGFYYSIDTRAMEATVTSGDTEYTGSVTIPETITYKNVSYSVTSIGSGAFSGCSGLTSVTIPNSVTSIGQYAFADCSGLTSLTIPNSVTEIGKHAFDGCSGLTSVTIPNSVTSIGQYAFADCSGLTSLTIGDNVTSIGAAAFYGCTGLTSVTIPNSVTSIGSNAFNGCSSLTSVHITDLAAWCKINFISSNYNPLYYAKHLFMDGKEITDLVIPNSVTEIGKHAFDGCSGLTSLTIPNSVTRIRTSAFNGCSGLIWVIIGNNVTAIESAAFQDCSGLTSVTIPSSVTEIGGSAFSGCSGLTDVYCFAESVPKTSGNVFSDSLISSATLHVPAASLETYKATDPWNKFGSIVYIKYDAIINGICYNFMGNTMEATVTSGDTEYTGSVTIPETVTYNDVTYSVTSIGDYAFSGCSGLTSVTIPNSVTSIGNYAFYGCSNLTSVAIPNSVTSIGGDAFYGCSNLTSVTIPSNVTSIGNYAFYGCSNLTSVTIPNSVTSIGQYAFYKCTGLTSVHITDLAAWCKINFYDASSNPLYYAKHLFIDGKEITDLVIPNSVTNIGRSAFSGCSGLTSVTIPSSVTSIGNSAFSGCSGLTSVTIPSNVTSIGNSAFSGCSGLTSISVENGNTVYDSRADCNAIIETATNTLIAGCKNTVIPNSVTSVGSGAFNGFSGLTSVTIPNSVTSIGNYAFNGCSGLTSVTIPNSVTEIGQYAFYGCTGLTSVKIGNSVTSIGNSAFSGCSGLTSVTIGKSVRTIEYRAFKDCTGLKDVYCYAERVPTTAVDAFDSSPVSSATLHVPAVSMERYRVTSPWNEFGSIVVLYDAEIDGIFYALNVNAMEATVTSGDTEYTGSVTIPETVTYKDVTYGVTSIGDIAFRGCTGLTSVAIPNSVTSIGGDAFYGCRGMKSVHITDLAAWCKINFYDDSSNPLYYAKHLFIDGKEITDLVIPNSVTEIGKYAFYGCRGMTSVTIPNSVTIIGRSAFYSCSGLTSVHITDLAAWCKINFSGSDSNPLDYAEHLFMDGKEITDLTIPNSVTEIGQYAFYGCTGLTSVKIGNNVTSIGSNAFWGCSGLTSVKIGNNVTSIGENAFRCCGKLRNVCCLAERVPTTAVDAFDSSPVSSATLYVPAASLETYKATSPWSGFGTIVVVSYSATIDDFSYILDTYAKEATVKSVHANYTGNVTIPEAVTYNDVTYSVTSIGSGAFSGRSNLTSVTIPNSVTFIGYGAFSGCSGLTSVTIPNSVTEIGNDAFYGCRGLTSVTIPGNVTSIGNSAFSGCSGLTSISVENGNTVYDTRDNCNAIIETVTNTLIAGCKNTVIPSSVTSIGDYAFSGCSGLTSVAIPNSVTSIGIHAFNGCSGLTSVTIGNSVRTIEISAFRGCTGLKDVYCYAESVPKTDGSAFYNSPVSSATLHVLAASLEKYKATSPWSGFGTIVAIPEDDIDGIGSVSPTLSEGEGYVYDLNGRRVTNPARGIYIKNGKLILKR